MLIRSLEVESVGPIAGPIRLPLGTGLNVICGPNEIGKTTLARAAYTALTSPCWSNDVGVRRLMPRSGGHPRVCVEFDVGLFSCRLEKVFGGKRSLSRTDLLVEDPDGHSTRMSGDKAEERLAELLGMGPRPNRGKSRDWMGLWPLLWVQQGESSAEPSGALVGRGRNQLRNRLAALSGEVLAGVDQAPLLGAVQAEFLRYYSAGGRELSRAGSPLHEARLGHMRRVDAVEALEGKRREHEELIDTMNRSLDERLRLQDELPHLADEAAVAATNWEQAQLQEARCKEAAAHLAAEVAGWRPSPAPRTRW